MHTWSSNKRLVGFVVVAAILLRQANIGRADDNLPSRDQILSTVREWLGRYDKVDLSATIDVSYLVDGQSSSETSSVLIRREGMRALLSTKSCFFEPGKRDPTCRQLDQIVYDNDDVLMCGAGLTPTLARVGEGSDLRVSLLSSRIAGKQDITRETVWDGLNDGAAVLWIIGYRPLPDYFNEAAQVEFQLGESVAEVTATSVHGDTTIELDGTTGWLPKTVRIVKRADHRLMGKSLSEATDGKADNITFLLNVTKYLSDPEGQWLPRQITVERKTNWKNNNTDIATTVIEIQSARFDPELTDADFKSSIEIPVDYEVGIVGASHLPYVWDGREVIPGIPEKSYTRPRGGDFSPSGGSRFQWLITFNVLILVAFVAVMWRRSKTSLK